MAGGRAPAPGRRFRVQRCYVCNDEGHLASECPTVATDASGVPIEAPRKCHVCGSTDHLRKDCPDAGDAASSMECYTCHGKGHMSRDCPSKGASSGRDVSSLQCYICSEYGHTRYVRQNCNFAFFRGVCRRVDPAFLFPCLLRSRDCPSKGAADAAADYSDKQCNNCSEYGHIRCVALGGPVCTPLPSCLSRSLCLHVLNSRNCTKPRTEGNSKKCHSCGQPGHLRRDCPSTA